MLVLTTMLTEITDDLPKTASVKFIDVWVIFSLIIPVLEIVLHKIEDSHFSISSLGPFKPSAGGLL